jgi:phosphoribosyl 1,2-cyclic phosphodiesterase
MRELSVDVPARFTVLASGSAGNASFLEFGDFGLLIDCGLGPRVLGSRLAEVGRSWAAVSAVLLTHTHGDHWNPHTFTQLRSLRIPVFAHARHHEYLSGYSAHDPLRKAKLTVDYLNQPLQITSGLTIRPIEVPHDSSPTVAFRFDTADWSLGFASDLGETTPALFEGLSGVDVLALEFNHDVAMQKASRRPQLLIDRVLGTFGHLSNEQARSFAQSILHTGCLQALIQLHLSRECNRPELARAAARRGLHHSVKILTASQHHPTEPLVISSRRRQVVPTSISPKQFSRASQPTLPGF